MSRRRSWILSALLLAPAAAFAQDTAAPKAAATVRANQRPSRTGQPGERVLIGKVVRAEPNQVLVDSQGAVVPIAVTPDTRFEGTPGARVDALAPGEEVRARFSVSGGKNVATDLELTAPAAPKPPLDERQRQQANTPIDPDLRTPSLVPSTGEVKGPANPMPAIPR